jgi:hypothetical protein
MYNDQQKPIVADPFSHQISDCRVLLLPSWPVLDRLGQMRWGDFITVRQIGNRPRDLQDAMERPRRELQLLHRRPHERLTGRVEFAEDAHVGWRHVRVAYYSAVVRGESRVLTLSRGLHSRAHHRRRLAHTLAGELFIRHARHLDVDINAIQQRPADALLVARDHRRGTSTFLGGVTVIAARTGIHTI